jgi:hypothetical protein
MILETPFSVSISIGQIPSKAMTKEFTNIANFVDDGLKPLIVENDTHQTLEESRKKFEDFVLKKVET